MKNNRDSVGIAFNKKKALSLKWCLIALVVALMAGLQASTQYLAYLFKYQAVLGANLDHYYAPWSIVFWSMRWIKTYPGVFSQAINLGVLVSFFIVIIWHLIYRMVRNTAKAHISMYGTAKWASEGDIQKAGLLNNEGVYVGAFLDAKGELCYLRHNGPEHILTYAPTRSGKGVGLVLPTLLSWSHSVVITDLKGELWAMTAGWRQKYAKNKVLRFEPASKGFARLNPLNEVRIESIYEVGDVQNIATLIVDPDGKGLTTHWQTTSQSLIVGLILHILYKRKIEGLTATLPELDRIMVDPNQKLDDLWVEMGNYPHLDSGKSHPVVAAAGRDMIDREPEEACSIISTVKTYLALYRDPIVAENVSVSDFSIKDLMHYESPVSLYIITQPNDMTRLRPLVRMVLNLMVRLLADKMEFERKKGLSKFMPAFVQQKKLYKHRLLAMIDEFPSLGKLEIIQESLAFVAGYGIKFYLICQDINQLKSREKGYGADESITSNCQIQNAFPPNRIETAEFLSKSLGMTTVVKEQVTTSGKRGSLIMEQVSRTFQESQRPLLTADECARMSGAKKNSDGMITEAGDMIIYVANYPAIYGKQPLYFQDPIFVARAGVAAPLVSDKIRFEKVLTPKESVVL